MKPKAGGGDKCVPMVARHNNGVQIIIRRKTNENYSYWAGVKLSVANAAAANNVIMGSNRTMAVVVINLPTKPHAANKANAISSSTMKPVSEVSSGRGPRQSWRDHSRTRAGVTTPSTLFTAGNQDASTFTCQSPACRRWNTQNLCARET